MKILMVTTTSNVVINFRTSLIKELQMQGHEVIVISGDDIRKKEILDLNVKFYKVEVANRSFNPFANLTYIKNIKNIVKEINPDLAITFMLKPNTFGVIGLKKAKCSNIYSMIEGMGDTFINKGLIWNFIRYFIKKLYKISFKNVKKIFVLNQNDFDLILENKIVSKEKLIKIDGIGIDSHKFDYEKIENYNHFLMVARLLKTKGVLDYCMAAQIIKEKNPEIQFDLVGPEGNLTKEDIKYYIDKNIINYYGEQFDIRPFVKSSSIFVLPSYREGLPIAVQEAMSIGRGVILTDVPGCRDLVKEGYNGFLCEVQNPKSIALKMEKVINNKNLIDIFSLNSRKMIVEQYDQAIINKKIIEVITK